MSALRIPVAAAILLIAAPALAQVFQLFPSAERRALARFELRDLTSKRFRSSDAQGKVMVLSFWATWCAPCKQELTALHQIAKEARYGDDLMLIAVNTDGPETTSQVRSEVKRRNWIHRILRDDAGRVNAKLNPRGSMPFTIFVDKQGRIAYAHVGYQSGDEKYYAKLIQQLMAEKQS